MFFGWTSSTEFGPTAIVCQITTTSDENGKNSLSETRLSALPELMEQSAGIDFADQHLPLQHTPSRDVESCLRAVKLRFMIEHGLHVPQLVAQL